MSSQDLKFEFHGSNSTHLNNIFTNNSETVNPLLPFGVHINGGVSVCVTKCGHTLNNCDNIKIENVINYGKMLVMVPNKKDSELILHYDARNDNSDQNGNGKYLLKYICFTCPPTIKIGDIDSDIQSYLVYTNSNGLYCVICTLYRNASPIDTLGDSLLNTLLNNNIPKRGSGGSLKDIINLSDFFPQSKQDFYEFINTEKNSKDIKDKVLVKVYAKKINIGTTAINNLKQKLFDASSNNTYNNFKDLLDSNYSNKPQNINIFYVPDLGLSKVCSTKERMENIQKNIKDNQTEEEDYDVEEETSIIEKLTKANLEDKKEKFINFKDDLKLYKCDLKNGHPKKVFKNTEYVAGEDDNKLVDYITYKELLLQNPDYDEDELKRSVNEFPNYIYKNAYWRTDYTVRLYKNSSTDDKSEVETDFEIIDVDSIEDAVKKIGNSTPEDVFYSMKNFPNVPVDDYYVTYYYNNSKSQNMYVKIMYILFCVLIILFNFLFYKYIFYVTNKDYGNLSITDDEIINDDYLKKLASWRLLINLIFLIQIITTIIYSVFKISNVIHDDKAFNGVFLTASILSLISTLTYAYIRLNFSSLKVSYSEHKSMKILLEGTDESEEEEKGFISYLMKASDLLKNSLLYQKSKTDSSFKGLFKELTDLKDQLDQYESNNYDDKELNKFSEKAESVLTNLENFVSNNNNNDNSGRSRFEQHKKMFMNKLDSVWSQLKASQPFYSGKSKKTKNKALKIITQIKKILGHEEGTPNKNSKEEPGNESKEESEKQEGGNNSEENENNNESPIITGLQRKSNSKYDTSGDFNNNNEFESNKSLNGTMYFPNTNKLENDDDFDDEIEEGDFFKNLLESITIKNLFIYLVFLVVFTTIAYKIRSIINTFDTTTTQHYKSMTDAINLFSMMTFYGIFSLAFFLKLYDFYKWYFVGEKDKNKLDETKNNKGVALFVIYVIWFIIVLTGFDFSTDNSFENSRIASWVFISLFLLAQIIIIFKPVFATKNWSLLKKSWKIHLMWIASILFFILPPALKNNGPIYKAWLALLPIIIALTLRFSENLIESDKDIEIKDGPITLMNINNLNSNGKTFQEPISLPNIEELQKTLNELKQTGGASKEQKKKLNNYINNLNEISEYFKKNGKIGNQQIVDRIKDDILDLI